MTNGQVSDLMYEVFVMAIQLAGPPLLLSMLIGILISIIQAATQIHEQTLTFVPKLLVIGVVLVFTGSGMLANLQDLRYGSLSSYRRDNRTEEPGRCCFGMIPPM